MKIILTSAAMLLVASGSAFYFSSLDDYKDFNIEGIWALNDHSCDNFTGLLKFTNNKIIMKTKDGKIKNWGDNYNFSLNSQFVHLKVNWDDKAENLKFDIVNENKIQLVDFTSGKPITHSRDRYFKMFTLNRCQN